MESTCLMAILRDFLDLHVDGGQAVGQETSGLVAAAPECLRLGRLYRCRLPLE